MFKKEEKEVQVKCEECKHYIDKHDAIPVAVFNKFFRYMDEYYCPMHKRPYTKKKTPGMFEEHLGDKFFNEFEVDEQGSLIGYIKAEETEELDKNENN